MSVRNDIPLKLVVDNSNNHAPLENLLDQYAGEIEAQRAQLIDDLEYFQAKLRELEALDPLDFTGLGKVYREHEQRISALLAEMSERHAVEA